MKHVLAIAQRPHPIGRTEHDRVRDYLLAHLRMLGLHPEVQNATGVGTRSADAGTVQNRSRPLLFRSVLGEAAPDTAGKRRSYRVTLNHML
jgi:hypothetical protein